MQSYSIAQARDKFATIVHDVEKFAPVEVTRRGKPIAFIVSAAEYARLQHGRQDFWDAVLEFRQSVDWEAHDNDDVFADVRDRTIGSEANPWLDS